TAGPIWWTQVCCGIDHARRKCRSISRALRTDCPTENKTRNASTRSSDRIGTSACGYRRKILPNIKAIRAIWAEQRSTDIFDTKCGHARHSLHCGQQPPQIYG